METAIFHPVKSVANAKIKCVVTKYTMIHGVLSKYTILIIKLNKYLTTASS